MEEKPGILFWQAVFCYTVAVLAFCSFMFLTLAIASTMPFADMPEDFFTGIICYSIPTLPVCLVYGITPLLPRRPWSWAINVIATFLAMPTLCLLPAALPLVMGLWRPEVRAWYGKSPH